MTTVHIDQLVDLDPDRDLRTDRGSVEELAASIIELGLLEPITVIPQGDGRFTIYAGHRRRDAIRRACELLAADPARFDLTAEQATARADALREVPCYPRPDLAGRDVLAQIAENGERLGLTDAERARGLQLALTDGLDVGTISRATGIKAATVRAAQKVASLPAAAQDALASGQLGLDDAAALEEFADDPKAVERILRGSHTGYALADERLKRQRRTDTAELRERLPAEGYALCTRPKDFGYASQAAELCQLADEQGKPLTVEEHGLLDGHAVFVDTQTYASPRAVHICRDPEGHGHTRLRPTSYVTPEEIARREAADAARRELADKMAAAREVRTKFLRSLIGSQKAAAKHTDLLVTIAARWPRTIENGQDHPLIEQLCPEPEAWTGGRLHQRAVAAAVLGADAIAERADTWRGNYAVALWWWDQLPALGYELTPAEVEHRDATRTAHDKERAATAAAAAAARAAALAEGQAEDQDEDQDEDEDEDEDQEDPEDEVEDEDTADARRATEQEFGEAAHPEDLDDVEHAQEPEPEQSTAA